MAHCRQLGVNLLLIGLCLATILYSLTDSELVTFVSLGHTYCVVMIRQYVSLVDFYLQWNTY